MKFEDFKYVRPSMDEVKTRFDKLLKQFEAADNFTEVDKIMSDIIKLRNEFETMQTLVSIRHSINTVDEFYEKEMEFFNENVPLYQEEVSKYYQCLLNSKFKNELEEKWGTHLFNIAELALKTFSKEIIEELQKENKLSSNYQKLIASAKIMFEGEERNLSQMAPFTQSLDRSMRK